MRNDLSIEDRERSRSPVPTNLKTLEAAVLETAHRRSLFGPADRILVALSGGADSTALVAALAALRDAGAIAEVRALHVDHGLRPDSGEDAAAAAASCRGLGVAFESVRVGVARGNVQAEARRARYEALREGAARAGATRIATAHTRTDQAETVLLRLVRGAGARGLSGIPARRGRIVRPLIERSREEIRAYLASRGLSWREDPTNATARYARNRVRHAVLPLLARENPAVEAALARAADLAREDERALTARARALLAPEGTVPVRALRRAPVAVRRRVVRLLWRAARGTARGLTADHVESVLALLAGEDRPRSVDLPQGVVARARYGQLSLAREEAAPPPIAPVDVPVPGLYRIAGRDFAVEVGVGVAVAGSTGSPAIGWPLLLRARRPGDRFRPAGGGGDRKLKAWLIDRRIPRERRDGLVLLTDAAGRVLAIPELAALAEGTGELAIRLRPNG
jgi:tRNA(Ile)-lysidine synthase